MDNNNHILPDKGVLKTRRGMILAYPYSGMQVNCHLHPNFVICHIGMTLQSAIVNQFKTILHQNRRSPHNEWKARIQTLLKCQAIYGEWLAMSKGKLDAWREAQKKTSRPPKVTNSADSVATTPGRYCLRSSEGSQMH
jgi:hypothetical protein